MLVNGFYVDIISMEHELSFISRNDFFKVAYCINGFIIIIILTLLE